MIHLYSISRLERAPARARAPARGRARGAPACAGIHSARELANLQVASAHMGTTCSCRASASVSSPPCSLASGRAISLLSRNWGQPRWILAARSDDRCGGSSGLL